MNSVIRCDIDMDGRVFVHDDSNADAAIGVATGVDERASGTYRYDLARRRLLTDRGTAASDRAARHFVEESLASPDKLMTFATEGHLPKRILASLLVGDQQRRFLEACAIIEKKYTDDCTAKNDPCLESGCAVAGEVCLEPVLRAGSEYHKACAAEWVTLFAGRGNRVDAWKD
jgi:hypothetical protein